MKLLIVICVSSVVMKQMEQPFFPEGYTDLTDPEAEKVLLQTNQETGGLVISGQYFRSSRKEKLCVYGNE